MELTIMKKCQYILSALLITILTGCGSAPSTPKSVPNGLTQSATFTVKGTQAMRLAAGTSGEGSLIFHGWQHPFDVSHAKLKISDKAGDFVEVHGIVYNLNKVEDFNGTYAPIKANLEAGKGLQGAWARNDEGVTIYVDTTDKNVEVNLEAKGATITLK